MTCALGKEHTYVNVCLGNIQKGWHQYRRRIWNLQVRFIKSWGAEMVCYHVLMPFFLWNSMFVNSVLPVQSQCWRTAHWTYGQYRSLSSEPTAANSAAFAIHPISGFINQVWFLTSTFEHHCVAFKTQVFFFHSKKLSELDNIREYFNSKLFPPVFPSWSEQHYAARRNDNQKETDAGQLLSKFKH